MCPLFPLTLETGGLTVETCSMGRRCMERVPKPAANVVGIG